MQGEPVTASIPVLLSFVARHGICGLVNLSEQLNAEATLSEISQRMDADVTYLSRVVHSMFVKTYHLHPDLQTVVDRLMESDRERYEETKRNSAKILTLIKSR